MTNFIKVVSTLHGDLAILFNEEHKGNDKNCDTRINQLMIRNERVCEVKMMLLFPDLNIFFSFNKPKFIV
jgi:hypothetical protein